MPRDQARVAETKEWLERAADDLQAADYLLQPTPPHTRSSLFHTQQAAEKTMKAFLAWHDVPFRKTHNLETIGEACLMIDKSLRRCIDRAVPLSEYVWRFRYPGAVGSPPRREAKSAFRIASDLFDAVLARLPQQVKP